MNPADRFLTWEKSSSDGGKNIFEVEDVRKPAPGIIVHFGKVKQGKFSAGDRVVAEVDQKRRQDIMRNHTATHLLHAQLRKVLGEHVRQAGSLVAPDRLRFDFTHPSALSQKELQQIEKGINEEILNNYALVNDRKKSYLRRWKKAQWRFLVKSMEKKLGRSPSAEKSHFHMNFAAARMFLKHLKSAPSS